MIPMSFMKQSANLQPIEDTVFAVVSMAKQDIAEHGGGRRRRCDDRFALR